MTKQRLQMNLMFRFMSLIDVSSSISNWRVTDFRSNLVSYNNFDICNTLR